MKSIFKMENKDNLKMWTNKVNRFSDMNLPENLLKGIYCYGFDKPSAIQQRAITALMTGNDLIAQSQSGTGKTGAFRFPYTWTRAGDFRPAGENDLGSLRLQKPKVFQCSRASSLEHLRMFDVFEPRYSKT